MQNSKFEIRFKLHPAPCSMPDRQPASQALPGGKLPRVTQVLALAIQFQDMLQRGDARDYADLARLAGVGRERLSQIMKLIWLAPDIQIELLYLPPTTGGRYPISEVAVRSIAVRLSWAEQRALWATLKHGERMQ